MSHSKNTNDKSGKLQINRRTLLQGASAAGLSLSLGSALSAPVLAEETPKKGGHLVVGLTGGATTDSLDPTLSDSQAAGDTLRQYQDRLIYPTPDGRSLEPMILESWDHTNDLKTWKFNMRKGITFHNGKTATAKDVLYSLNRHRGANSKSGAVGNFKTVTDIKIVDDHAIEVSLKEPNVEFPYLMTDYHVVLQPEGEAPDSGIGTGPYKIKEFKPGVRYLTEKFEDYWRPNVGFVDSIETLVINDNSARVSALIGGQVHIIDRVEPKVVALLEKAGTVQVVPTKGRGHYVFCMRCDAAPFDNADLRMALKLCIDREEIVKQVQRGFATVGNDSPINASYPLASDFTQRKYDPDEAAKLYKKSGHSGSIVLQVSDVAFPGAVDCAVLYKAHAARAGITIDVKRVPGDGYWDDVWNKQPFCASYWDGRPTQDQMLATAYTSDATWNETAWKRPEFDALLSKARSEADEAKRAGLYKRAVSMIRDDGGVIVPMFSQYLDAISKRVKGYRVDLNNELSSGRFCETVWLDS